MDPSGDLFVDDDGIQSGEAVAERGDERAGGGLVEVVHAAEVDPRLFFVAGVRLAVHVRAPARRLGEQPPGGDSGGVEESLQGGSEGIRAQDAERKEVGDPEGSEVHQHIPCSAGGVALLVDAAYREAGLERAFVVGGVKEPVGVQAEVAYDGDPCLLCPGEDLPEIGGRKGAERPFHG